jgi:TolA-binding protein
MHVMISPRTALLLLLTLASCGSSEAPEAAPGAVERTTAELDRNDATERRDTIRRIENEAEARTDRFERRIEAIERKGTGN